MQSFLTPFKMGEGILSSINLIFENIPRKHQINNSAKERAQEKFLKQNTLVAVEKHSFSLDSMFSIY